MNRSRSNEDEDELTGSSAKPAKVRGLVLVQTKARSIDVDFFASMLVGLAIDLASFVALYVGHNKPLAVFGSVIGTLQFVITLITYVYRFYTNEPSAGKTFMVLAMLGQLVLFIVFSVWATAVKILH